MDKLNSNKRNILFELQDYMFTSNNINKYTKHIINFHSKLNDEIIMPKSSLKNIKEFVNKSKYKSNIEPNIITSELTVIKSEPTVIKSEPIDIKSEPTVIKSEPSVIKSEPKIITSETTIKNKLFERKKETIYKPKQKDSLFWCFYILKNGFSNYEMEINNQYFVVEKNEKFKYIDLLRKNKDILKIHKIKPLSQLEDELANKDRISPKTFFALCVIENINVLLVDKRKVYELLCTDIDTSRPINIVHRHNEKYEHFIELDVSEETINKYRETYYKLTSFDTTLKSIGSYKLEELIDLCKKLNINIEDYKNNSLSKKKMTKKDIYELLVMKY